MRSDLILHCILALVLRSSIFNLFRTTKRRHARCENSLLLLREDTEIRHRPHARSRFFDSDSGLISVTRLRRVVPPAIWTSRCEGRPPRWAPGHLSLCLPAYVVSNEAISAAALVTHSPHRHSPGRSTQSSNAPSPPGHDALQQELDKVRWMRCLFCCLDQQDNVSTVYLIFWPRDGLRRPCRPLRSDHSPIGPSKS